MHAKMLIFANNFFDLKLLIGSLFIFFSIALSAQNYTGKIVDDKDESIPGAIIRVSGSEVYAVSRVDGSFALSMKSDSLIQVEVSFLGYGTTDASIASNVPKTIVLTIKSNDLKQVTIKGQSRNDILRTSPQTVSSIDVRPLQSRSLSTQQIINRSSGVQVRETGGLGSFSNYSINGISGKGIKFFVDGIPLDNTGYASDINLIPINLISSIEIYKGLVPVELGADALGGAINVVSRSDVKDYVDASFEYSSFNTYRSTLAVRKTFKKYLFTEVRAFHNYSDNNYFVDAEIANDRGKIDTVRVRRFHDAFESYNVGVFAGIQNHKYADLFKVGFEFSEFDKEIQHQFASMKKPFGAVNIFEQNKKFSAVYKKDNFFVDGLDANIYFFHLDGTSIIADTGKANYNWYGEEVNRFSFGAEVSFFPRLLNINTINDLGRVNLSYKLDKRQNLNFNAVYSKVTQSGFDTVFSAQIGGENPFAEPQFLQKTILGFAHEINWFKGRLTNVTSVKWNALAVRVKGNLFDVQDTLATTRNENFAYSEAMKFSILPNKLWAIANYEYAVRLPDQYEQFGNRVLIIANPDLVAEKSKNVNLSLNTELRSKVLFQGALRYFQRDTRDFIRLVIGPAFAQYQNFGRVVSRGGELELKIKPLPILQIGLSATYQDLRNRTDTNNLYNNAKVPQKYFNTKVPNIPPYFGNVDVQFFRPSVFKKGDVLTLAFNSSYVPEFFLLPEIDGDVNVNTKVTIPMQWVNDLGISYTLPRRKAYASVEVKNIADINRFDNFGVQKPGRSIHFKIGTFLQ